MILNQSADYALRAVLYLAGAPPDQAISADLIAQAIGVPRNYLGKVLHQLVRSNILASTRGPHGGFALARAAVELPVEAVVVPFQELPARTVCLLGDRRCDPTQPCAAHRHWRDMADPVLAFFRTTTIEQMLREKA